MSGWSQTDIETKMEMEEEFYAIVESIKSEDERNSDIKPSTLPEKLCAMPYNNMVDIFSSLETTKDILEKIEYSLPIMELERCHRFRKSVAEAGELLLAFGKLASMKSEETEINNDLSLLHIAQPSSTEYDNVDGPSETNSDIEMNDNESTIIPKDAQTPIRLRSCSVVLSILKTCFKDNSGAENGEKSLSNTEERCADSTTEVLDVERTASENDEESTCDSGVNTENPDDFALTHSRNQLLRCDVCAKTFKWKRNLTQHRKIHTNQGLRLHKCNTCAKTFTWKSNLTRHSKIHTGEGLHSCQYCEKSFYQASKLKRHAAIHSEERNYRCPLCDKSFKTPDASKRHVKLVHPNNRPWRCAHCNKTFGHKSQLRQHLGTCKLSSE